MQQQVLHFGALDEDRGLFVLSHDNSRFINHRDHPNIVAGRYKTDDVAARDISFGEELTMDYWEFDASAECKLSWDDSAFNSSARPQSMGWQSEG